MDGERHAQPPVEMISRWTGLAQASPSWNFSQMDGGQPFDGGKIAEKRRQSKNRRTYNRPIRQSREGLDLVDYERSQSRPVPAGSVHPRGS